MLSEIIFDVNDAIKDVCITIFIVTVVICCFKAFVAILTTDFKIEEEDESK